MRTASLRVRCVLTLFLTAVIRSFYRIDLREGVLPEKGPALIAANHTAYVDPFVLVACSGPPLRFVYRHGLDRVPIVGWFCRFSGGIPTAGATESPAIFERAMREVDHALACGEVVAIFPEGGLTRDGEVGPFERGIERIARARPTQRVPRRHRRSLGQLLFACTPMRPRSLRPRITLAAGAPIAPEDLAADELRDEVLRLCLCAAT